MRDAFSLYFYYCKTSMKAWFQYRVDAFLRIFAVMARESTAVIIMIFIGMALLKRILADLYHLRVMP